MARWRIWLLPALLAACQLALWPGLALTRGDTDPVRAAAGTAVAVLVAAALCRRHREPVAVAAVVAAGISLGRWVVPDPDLLVLSLADLVALYSVAVRRSRRTTIAVVACLVLWQGLLLTADGGFTGDDPVDLPITVVVYLIVAASGRIRRRWLAERSAAAGRLAAAERARLEAAATERRRLAREMHDVTAHHLTSIVVQVSAAQFLGDQRPQLLAEALDFAARTGRETLADLRRLVAILPAGEDPPGGPAPSLADLADDFRQLGQVVTVEIAGEPPPEIAEAMHGIAREALTNTLRYAPGGRVRLSVGYGPDGAELLVEDDGAGAGAAGATGLGGGRGLTGMRERAEALGGTLHAGPRAGRGWRVRALLPGPSGPRAAGRRLRRWLRSERVLDGGVALLTLVVPLAGVAAMIEEDRPAPAAATLILLAIVAHAAPLLWRRQHPWPVLAAVALTTWLGPLLVATRVAPAGGGWLFLFSVGADLAACYAVAVYATRPGFTWIAPLAATASTAFALSVLLAVDVPADGETPPGAPMAAVFIVVLAIVAGVVLALPLAGSWLAGHAARRRRQRRIDGEEAAVAVVAAQAEMRTRDERTRVAAGLREAVLGHAARVPRAAEEGDLTGVLDSAREALAAMRALLDGLGSRPATSDQPIGPDREVPSSPSV